MIQSFFILADTGEVLFEKQWSGKGGDRSICSWFWKKVKESNSPEDIPPLIPSPHNYVFHIIRAGMTFLACTSQEMSPLIGIEFLKTVSEVLGDYVGGLSEDNLKDNFVSVYEVLDEMMEGGFPLTTEPNVLKELVPPPSVAARVMHAVTGVTPSLPAGVPASVGSHVPWRAVTVSHTSNEVYCDVIEEVDGVMDRNGNLVRSEIYGELQVTSRLSGLPEITILISNPSIICDFQLHRCIKSHIWDTEKSLNCIPPDGNCTLMTYRVKGIKNIPLYVKPQISCQENVQKFNVVIGLKNDPGRPIEGVVIEIPLSKFSVSVDLRTNHGTVTFDHITKNCTWNIGKLPKEKISSMTGTVQLNRSTESGENGNPIFLVKFRVPGAALSGLKVSEILVKNENYRPYKSFRALTKTRCFEVRT